MLRMVASLARASVLAIGLAGCSLYFAGQGSDPAPSPDAKPPTVTDGGQVDGGQAALMPLATDEPGIYEMAVDSTHLYWVEDGQFDHEANVRRMPLGGGAIETLFSTPERMYSLAVSDGFVYAAYTGPNYAGQIYRIPAAGGSATSLTTAFNPTSVSVDGSWVYYTEAVSPGGRILRIPTTGGATEVVASDVDNPWDIVATDGVLFYSEMNRGRIMRVTPGETPVELAGGWIGTNWMAVDSTNVYFSACDVGSCEQPGLFRVARTGGADAEMMVGSSADAKLAVATNTVQWGANVVPIGGGASTPLAAVTPIAVAAVADAYYFADFFTGAIYRAPL